ncbi:family 57 glycoside hydrolase [Tothia fuscella]|uniref:Family 57 glycoside hydrolase n=1 Tax=Tothia fuscella TaxID=1048955 RepID=A0A9P4TW02_9PEZI|nr:family 57 glycoside hydrolase [Tothia fuscella]
MSDFEDVVDDLPYICDDKTNAQATTSPQPVSATISKPFEGTKAAFACILHMHQPLIPAGGDDLKTAKIICNLQYMMEHQNTGDNHNASVFLKCYERMGDFIPDLVAAGHDPRIMLEYSGCLLYGLRQMGEHAALEKLKRLTKNYHQNVEWLGAPWGHAVAPSTPIQDYRYHVLAFQQHFKALFGADAAKRLRGFSPSEMALPNHPDVHFEFVKTLKECGYQWVIVQEHTVEAKADGSPLQQKHIPHRLVATNSSGESISIIAIIKTQGSDTKLVGQMQPYYEAKSSSLVTLAGKNIPPLVTQIADGENGGVMMNEFPPKYHLVMEEASHGEVKPMNVSDYLDHLIALGITENDLPVIQPIRQHRLWKQMGDSRGSEALQSAVENLRSEDSNFHMEGGSWTDNISWVRGYENLLGPMEKLSLRFEEVVARSGVDKGEKKYRNALFHLLCTQTSCFRYWGQGLWTDFGLEIIRRGNAIIDHDFGQEKA